MLYTRGVLYIQCDFHYNLFVVIVFVIAIVIVNVNRTRTVTSEQAKNMEYYT